MLEVLFELFLDVILEACGEGVLEGFLRCLREPFSKSRNPWIAIPGYAFFGAVLGGLSILGFPNHMVRSELGRKGGLIGAPLMVGLLMGRIAAWRNKENPSFLCMEQFSYAFTFALSFGVTRYFLAS